MKGKGKGKGKGKWKAPSFDPRMHDAETLNTFVSALSDDDQHFVRHRLKRVQKRRQAVANLENLQQTHKLTRLLSLIKHTQAHPSFAESYDSLPSHKAGWASPDVAKQSFDPDLQSKYVIEDNLISIDCEMVATAEDDSALARISVVDGRCNVLLDRLVAPDTPPIDLRTHITGITEKDLEGLQYTREDARADLLKFITPRTVFVGHTLDKDLGSLRLDVPMVVDMGLLYGLEGMPTRRPALKYLMEAVLGHENFRVEGQAHDSNTDASGAMQILLHRLIYPEEDTPRVLLPSPAVDGDVAHILYAHRVADQPGMFTALVALFASVGAGMGAQHLEGIEMHPARKGWRSANVIFATAAEAERVFLALDTSEVVKVDRAGRPQKLVEMSLPGGKTATIYVRTMDGRIGGASLPNNQKGAAAASASTGGVDKPKSPRAWRGWKHALDEELAEAGGALPVKRLRTALVARYREGGAAADEGDDDEDLGNHALACIPEKYLSRADALVRRPRR